ncbi:MAG TPA: adenylate/guanylate cyclase domain-containing protein [Acidimicrobiia bacterium]
MTEMIDRGELDRITLRFIDDELEARFQRDEGAAGLAGYRIITAATVVSWVMAAILIPFGSDISFALSGTVGGAMAVVGAISLTASIWATTMNRQHILASLLTSANGLVILMLAVAGDFVDGYAVGAVMLLFLFGFVSRTRFVFAAVRTLVIALGLAFVVAGYEGQGSLVLDVFFFVIASIASLVGLQLLERNRRRVWHQRLVIEEQGAAIEVERSESERLLLNVLPRTVSERLRRGESPIADDYPDVSVIFADIVGFTPTSAEMSAHDVITMLSDLFSTFDDLVAERGLEKIKTIGDAYMAAGGLPEPLEDHAVRTVDLGLEMLEATRSSGHYPGLSLRIGIHSGPVAGGVIGTRKFAFDLWGSTVNQAARLETTGIPGRIHVSEETKGLTQEVFRYEPRKAIELRGLGKMKTYLVVDRRLPDTGEAISGRALEYGPRP